MNPSVRVAVWPLLLCISFAQAQEPAQEVAIASTLLDTVIVTASRVSETQSDSLAAVSVLERADIERLQAVDLIQLLAGLPGVSLSNTGGAGKETSLFLRGTESDHVLVLIDGIKVGSATSGKAALEQIPLDQIERMELVRGPRSSLYGSEAIGGVLQIFTRRGDGAGLVPSFSAFGGNRGSATTEAGLRGGIGKAWYAASLSGRSTDGINAQRSANEPDDDGYAQLAGALRGGWRFDKGAELSAHWLRADGDSDYDSRFSVGDDSTETRLEVLGAQARMPLLPVWQASLSAGLSRDESDIELDDVRTARFDTRREHFSWLNELRLGGAHSLAVGADHLRDHVDSTAAFAIDARTDTGAFAQYQASFDEHELQLSLRHDDDEQFGEHTTGGAAWGWRFTPGLRASASYGSAFRAPSFNELYFPNFGNPDLGPEKARSTEIGLDGRHPHWSWSLHAYHTEIDDLIATVLVDPDNFVFAPVNVAEARIVGVEAVVGTRLAAWRVQTTLSWLDPEDRSGGASDGKVLRRRAKESGRIDVDRDFGRGSLGASIVAVGKRYEDAANTQTLAGYATLALRGEWHLLPAWTLQASIGNALDKDYETARDYNQPGIGYWLGLRYRPTPRPA